jgi:hypothetical protein
MSIVQAFKVGLHEQMLKRTAIAGLWDGVVPRLMVLVEVTDNHEEADTCRRHSEKPLQRLRAAAVAPTGR